MVWTADRDTHRGGASDVETDGIGIPAQDPGEKEVEPNWRNVSRVLCGEPLSAVEWFWRPWRMVRRWIAAATAREAARMNTLLCIQEAEQVMFLLALGSRRGFGMGKGHANARQGQSDRDGGKEKFR